MISVIMVSCTNALEFQLSSAFEYWPYRNTIKGFPYLHIVAYAGPKVRKLSNLGDYQCEWQVI